MTGIFYCISVLIKASLKRVSKHRIYLSLIDLRSYRTAETIPFDECNEQSAACFLCFMWQNADEKIHVYLMHKLIVSFVHISLLSEGSGP